MPCSSVISVSHAKGHADGARIARKTEHRAGVARLRTQILEVVRVEEILDPKRSFPRSRRNVTDADVHKAVAVDVEVFGIRRVGIERSPVARINSEIRLAVEHRVA